MPEEKDTIIVEDYTFYEVYPLALLRHWRKLALRFGDTFFAAVCSQAIKNKKRSVTADRVPESEPKTP